jgi:hypothetical protein
MGETDKKLGSQRRRLLSEKLRRYFEELRADLEADSEAFFQHAVMQTAPASGTQPGAREITRVRRW